MGPKHNGVRNVNGALWADEVDHSPCFSRVDISWHRSSVVHLLKVVTVFVRYTV